MSVFVPLKETSYSLFYSRDESAAATFFYLGKTEEPEEKEEESLPPKPNPEAPENLVEEWMYYRSLKPGESEFPLRNKQVHIVIYRNEYVAYNVLWRFRNVCSIPQYPTFE